MLRTNWGSLQSLAATIILSLLSTPAYAHHAVGTRASSQYGVADMQTFWEYAPVTQATLNGVAVSAETLCPFGGLNTSSSPSTCTSTYVFLYQIQTGPNNLVLTFSGLTNFMFNDSGFGVLTCDPSAAGNMLCTQNLTTDQINSLNIGWDSLDGDLILTVPSVPEGDTLTFYIAESAPASGLPASPTLVVGGAVVVPTTMTFGSVELAATGSPQTLTIANSDDFATSLSLSKTTISQNFAETGSCEALGPGQACAMSIVPSPTASGTLTGAIDFSDSSPIGNESAVLNGNGTTGGITLSSSNLIFGPQVVGTFSLPTSVTITNSPSNSQSLIVSGIAFTPNPATLDNDFTENDNCTNTPVSPGSTCTVQVSSLPSISGVVLATMTISDNSPSGSHLIQLRGNGVVANSSMATPVSLTFPAQTSGTTSASQTITVENEGSSALTIGAVNTTAAFGIESDLCSTAGTLSSNATCTVSVFFQPTQAGPFTGTLTIADDASGGTLVVPLSGTGLPPPASVPTFSVPGGTYTSVQSVVLSDSTPQATIYYTTDGTTPTTSSLAYTAPISIASSETVEAIATAPGYTTSSVAVAKYTINLPPPSFAIQATALTVAAGATNGNTSTIAITPVGGFTGSVALSAAITSSPTNAVDPPELSFGSSSPAIVTGANGTNATLTVTTTAATIAAYRLPEPERRVWGDAGTMVLSVMLFVVVPVNRRRKRWMLGLCLLAVASTTSIVACGGGSPKPGDPGTTAGPYTITIKGTSGSLAATATISLTVNP